MLPVSDDGGVDLRRKDSSRPVATVTMLLGAASDPWAFAQKMDIEPATLPPGYKRLLGPL